MNILFHRALFIGRFNPFHNGHLSVIHEIFGDSEKSRKKFGNQISEIIIAVGSSQESHTLKNPFTGGERIEMIRTVLSNSNIPSEKYLIIPIPDVHRNAIWVNHVESMCPRFHIVITSNNLTSRLFSEANYTVVSPTLVNRSVLSASEVRKRMINGNDWQSLVPPQVKDLIKTYDGVTRIQNISGIDNQFERL